MIRLLLVEDDPTSRSFLCAAASALPAQVDVAASLAEARLLADLTTYDAWLIDAHLPDGSGSDLLAGLRAVDAATPAIAHTATRGDDALDALRDAGFTLALAKPLSSAAWRAAIRSVLADGGRRAPVADAAGASLLWNRAAALAAVGGNAANAEALRQLFLGELPGARDSVLRAADTADLDAMRHVLHRLRASCGFVGAERLGAAVATLHEAPQSPRALDAFSEAAAATLAGG